MSEWLSGLSTQTWIKPGLPWDCGDPIVTVSGSGNTLTSGVDQCSLKFEMGRVIGNDYIAYTNLKVKRLVMCGCGSTVAMETLPITLISGTWLLVESSREGVANCYGYGGQTD